MGSSKSRRTSVNIKRHTMEVSGMPVEVIRKDIKNLHLGVYPPEGSIRVAAPLRFDNDAIRLAVISRLGWIKKRRAGFEQQERQSERQLITGETHYVQGRRYRLDVVEGGGSPLIRLRNNTRLELRVPPGQPLHKRQSVLYHWYRDILHDQIPALIKKWEPVIGVRVADWGIKRMKTRWGTCNYLHRRIWLNLELAKKNPSCLEYIVVHEMVHLLEHHHNERFARYMDRFMSGWRMRREVLNRAPLSHEDWTY
jgi:predicted metal-dependent hydrolase